MSSRQYPVYVILLASLLILGLGWTPAKTFAQSPPTDGNVSVQISKDSAALTAGEWVEFRTVLSNDGAAVTPPLVAHLSITAVDRGRYVDPEDWSPERTQYLAPIPPGGSVRLNWKVHALFEGDLASFVTVLSPEKSFVPIVSSTLSIHVEPDNILPMAEVVPVAVVVPVFPLALLLFSVAHTRRRRPLPL